MHKAYFSCESESEVTQSCPTLWDPMDCSLSRSSVHGIFQARVLEWIAISFSRESSQLRNRTQVSHIAGRCFTIWATRVVSIYLLFSLIIQIFLRLALSWHLGLNLNVSFLMSPSMITNLKQSLGWWGGGAVRWEGQSQDGGGIGQEDHFLPQKIHQKIIWMLSNFHKTISKCWQRIPGTQKGSPFSSKGGRTKHKR